MTESPAMLAAETFDEAGAVHSPPQLALPEHIRKLQRSIGSIHGGYQRPHLPPMEGVLAPLSIAGAIYELKADTAIGDQSVGWCSSAGAYFDADSVVASRYVAATIMFNFCWMALEQTVLEVAPPFKGSAGARGRNAFARMPAGGISLASNLDMAWRLTQAAGDMKDDVAVLETLRSGDNAWEFAFELVRRIRNAFAHGQITSPQPLDWDTGRLPPPNPEVDRFFAATRLILLLIARLLADALRGETMECHFDDQIIDEIEDEPIVDVPIDWGLLTSHLVDPGFPAPMLPAREAA